jgi:uncharacterized repeat protein (TIGR03803 family)
MKLHTFWLAIRRVLMNLTLAILVFTTLAAQAQTYSVLYSFTGKHGKYPQAGLIHDHKGTLYGTTTHGGAYNDGTVFELKTTGKLKVLHSFSGGADGKTPQAGLVRDSLGNLYGTTFAGGAYNRGVVFKVDTTGVETVLHDFKGRPDGKNPVAGLALDSLGNLYGTTLMGGTYNQGSVFKVDATGLETILYSFLGSDGGFPRAGVVLDSEGNLYGTTGAGAYGYGTVFKLDTTDVETVLYTFSGGDDGALPMAGVVRDSAGNLYGTAASRGAYGYGAVFKLNTKGDEKALYSFADTADGGGPVAGLMRDSVGNLYGTASGGGDYNYGVVFKVDKTGTETVLHSFTGADGVMPQAGLVRDAAGNFYGTTYRGRTYNQGVVFKISPR